jgi:serine/threonine-protein kinase
MRVVIADDSMLAREGLARLLSEAGCEVVGTARNGDELCQQVAATHPDAAVVDIRMPPTHTDEGIVASKRVLSENPAIGVLVLSQYLESAYAMRLIQDQPDRVGYLLKDRVTAVEVLVDALQRVIDGECVVDPTIVTRLMRKPRRTPAVETLSQREREVLALVAEGRTNTAIADRLFMSPRTVEAHIRQIMSKFDLSDTPDDNRRVLAVLAFLRDTN